jgi:1-acyl-sn-glycerol-3-phosphate acyltransferase
MTVELQPESASTERAGVASGAAEPRRSLLTLLYPIYQWLVFVPLALALTVVFAALAVVSVALVSPRAASIWCGRPWARLLAWLTPARVRVVGRERVDPRVSYVVVANHLSLFDVFVLYGWLDFDFRWVMKHELRRIPGVGFACERIGHIFVDRSNPQAAKASIEAAKERLEPGTSVLFFPEGTRGPGDRLLPFKKGAFRLAAGLSLPILPVSIIGTDRILPARTLRFRPGVATLVYHEPLPPSDGEDLADLIGRVRETISAPLRCGDDPSAAA